MRLQVATSAAELERMRPLWEALFRNASATLFQSFDWNVLAARVFAGREQPYVVLAESASGAAIIPACVRKAFRTLSLLGEELFDYRDYLAVGDEAPLRAAWEKLAELGLRLELTALRGTDARDRWEWLAPEPFCRAPMAAPGEFREPKNMYALRRLFKLGACVRHYPLPSKELVQWIYLQKSQQQPNLFNDPLRRTFMQAAVSLPSSACEVFTLEADDHIIAALVTFLDAEARRFYTTYFDPRWAKYSPGYALLCEVTQRTVESGMAYDFMTGEQWYKMRLATSTVPLYRIRKQCIEVQKQLARETLLAS
jgi:CelD/BcsL family acetyltransferase involved in cellulose biosynthesis